MADVSTGSDFTATMKRRSRRDRGDNDPLGITAARAEAVVDFNSTMGKAALNINSIGDADKKRRRRQRRREKERAAAALTEDGDADAEYDDDFEDDAAEGSRSSGPGAADKSPNSMTVSAEMVAVNISVDHGFEGTISRRPKRNGGAKKGATVSRDKIEKEFMETMSGRGNHHRRTDSTTSLGGGGLPGPRRLSSDKGSLTDDALPPLAGRGNGTARSAGHLGGMSPPTSPSTSAYVSDSNASQLPDISHGRRRRGD